MEWLRPLFWGQGMLLQPQHFQQQDNYHDGRLRHFFKFFSPFAWGVYSLRVNETGLQNFVFEIEQCELVTFDGTLLRFGAELHPNTARIAPRSFEHDLDPAGAPLGVYVGVRRLQSGEANLHGMNGASGSTNDEGSHRRFILEEAEVGDLFAGTEQICQLQYLVHDAHILLDAGAERSQDYELVKIAEVLRSPDGKGGLLSKQYVPPCITIKSSPPLEAMLKETRDLLTAKGREIGQYTRRDGREVELSTRSLGQVLILQTLNRYIPPFHHHLETGVTQPETMYVLLRQLVGELSSFSSSFSVLGARGTEEGLPPYQHNNLWPCFAVATRRVRDLLNELTSTPVGDVLLSHDGEFFTAELDQQFLTGDNRYYLAIRNDLSPQQLYKLLQDTGKITSREDMPKLQKSFLVGLKIEVLETPPEELVMRAHYRYFLIDQRSDHWLKIRQQKNIAVYSTALAPQTEMRLLAIWGK
jgi:type VI secretion system protein ImpJ